MEDNFCGKGHNMIKKNGEGNQFSSNISTNITADVLMKINEIRQRIYKIRLG